MSVRVSVGPRCESHMAANPESSAKKPAERSIDVDQLTAGQIVKALRAGHVVAIVGVLGGVGGAGYGIGYWVRGVEIAHSAAVVDAERDVAPPIIVGSPAATNDAGPTDAGPLDFSDRAGLRPLTPVEERLRIEEMPSGAYAFAGGAWVETYSSGTEIRGLIMMADPSIPELEVQRGHDGQVRFALYVTQLEALQLGRGSAFRGVAFVTPYETSRVRVLVPASRIARLEQRRIRGGVAVDLEIPSL